MKGLEGKSAQIGAVVLLGLVLFNPPLVQVFNAGAARMVGGIPLLFFYLFFAWGVLIGLLAFVIERRPQGGGERPAVPRKENRGKTD
ncbi:MAG TPA: hypothetical protein VIG92_05090 [Rhodospirillales bacterium]